MAVCSVLTVSRSICWPASLSGSIALSSCLIYLPVQQISATHLPVACAALGSWLTCPCTPTGSADRTIRLWDLQAGIPRAVSRRLGGAVRGVAVDEDMLVAGTSQVRA